MSETAREAIYQLMSFEEMRDVQLLKFVSLGRLTIGVSAGSNMAGDLSFRGMIRGIMYTQGSGIELFS